SKPVFLLPFVEHDLQSSHANDQQADSPIVNSGSLAPQVGRIKDECLGEKNRDDPDRNIDIEDPPPAVVVRQPTAGDRTQHWRDYDSERPKRHCLPALLWRERLQQYRLGQGLQSPTTSALNDPKDDQERQRGCQPTE